MKQNNKLIIGIDEVGRGPLAGPVTLAAFAIEKHVEKWLLKHIFQNSLKDSKKLSVRKREEINKKLTVLKKEGKVLFEITHISNKVIDKKGISFAIKLALEKNLKKLEHKTKTQHRVSNKAYFIKLDGSLKAPVEFRQKTIIKGDEKEVSIACASIVAKVARDALMRWFAKKYPEYGFEIHKGYGTKLHRAALKKHGISDLHRVSFCATMASW